MSPSGTPLLNHENLVKLKEAGTKAISLSIDASTPESHDDFRQVPGSFELTVNGWQAARDIGLKLQVNTTVTRYNLTDLPQIFKRVQEMGAMTWSLFFLVPTGRALESDDLRYHLDYRQLYATVARRWWGLADDGLDGDFEPLSCLS